MTDLLFINLLLEYEEIRYEEDLKKLHGEDFLDNCGDWMLLFGLVLHLFITIIL